VLQLSRRHPLPKTPVTGLIWLEESPISPSLGSRDRLDSLPLGIAEFPSPSHALLLPVFCKTTISNSQSFNNRVMLAKHGPASLPIPRQQPF
jgi:hypothetical protein